MLSTLALQPWATNLLILALLGVAVLLILTVLIQRPQGGGLSAAFGSSGSGQTAFGTKTGDALTVFTVIMFTLLVLAAVGLNFAMRPSSDGGAPAAQAPGDKVPAGNEPTPTPTPTNPTAPSTAPTTAPSTSPATPPAGTPAPTTAPTPESEPQNPPPANPPTPESPKPESPKSEPPKPAESPK